MRVKCDTWAWVAVAGLLAAVSQAAAPGERLRIMIETDAGGDPDDEQSLVRFLLYTSEWDVEGIICNRPRAREGENVNRERTGLDIVRAQLKAYRDCRPRLILHNPGYPDFEHLWTRTVAGYDDTDDGVKLVMAAVDSPDPRPLWFCNWGTDRGSAPSSLKRALDRALKERGQAGYERFKSRIRLSSYDAFGGHTAPLQPPWTLWVDTFRPEMDRRRWYHRFSPLTATAGGFDLQRDVLRGHGPLGALYPTNTGLPQKEGDTMCFLYLVPTGMNDPEQPTWGSWAGRYSRQDGAGNRPYYWGGQQDTWQGTTSRDNTLKRWAVHLQNDFKARMDWCVNDFAHANHPPDAQVTGDLHPTAAPGTELTLDATASTDPDGHTLAFEWFHYPEPGTYQGPPIRIAAADSPRAIFVAPATQAARTVHLILMVTDNGAPPLTRYRRVIVTVDPKAAGREAGGNAAPERGGRSGN